MLGDVGEPVSQGVDDPVELGVDRLGVGLVADRVQQHLDPAPRVFGVVLIRFTA